MKGTHMKAYRCDRCDEFYPGNPIGVFYDKTDPENHRGERHDLCPECTALILADICGKDEEQEPDEGLVM